MPLGKCLNYLKCLNESATIGRLRVKRRETMVKMPQLKNGMEAIETCVMRNVYFV